MAADQREHLQPDPEDQREPLGGAWATEEERGDTAGSATAFQNAIATAVARRNRPVPGSGPAD